MNVVVFGADGYIGFPLSMHLAREGHRVIGVDSLFRRKWVNEVGSHSATPIFPMEERLQAFKQAFGKTIIFEEYDITDYNSVANIIKIYHPDVVYHLAEQASAPFSMMNVEHAILTQTNNLVGTLNLVYALKEYSPDCHLIKMGSMGEYRPVNIDIPEGFFEVEYRGRKAVLRFPRAALNDWYHVSKVHDSNNILLASEIWGLRSSDIMQGIVYGIRTEEMVDDRLLTRFDFDAIFGTVLNRFCAQTVLERDLTCYGSGNQKRPFISLRDALQCLTLVLNNPPNKGEYRVFNQFDEVYSIWEIAEKMKTVANSMGLEIGVNHCENPRIENETEQYFNPISEKLRRFGFRQTNTLEHEISLILSDLSKFKDRIAVKADYFMPGVYWKSDRALSYNKKA